jgi:hypothetical protein
MPMPQGNKPMKNFLVAGALAMLVGSAQLAIAARFFPIRDPFRRVDTAENAVTAGRTGSGKAFTKVHPQQSSHGAINCIGCR